MNNGVQLYIILAIVFGTFYLLALFFEIKNLRPINALGGIFLGEIDLDRNNFQILKNHNFRSDLRSPEAWILKLNVESEVDRSLDKFISYFDATTSKKIEKAIEEFRQSNEQFKVSINEAELVGDKKYFLNLQFTNYSTDRKKVLIQMRWKTHSDVEISDSQAFINLKRISWEHAVKMTQKKLAAIIFQKKDHYCDDWDTAKNIFWNFFQKSGIRKNIFWLEYQSKVFVFIENPSSLIAIHEKVKEFCSLKDDFDWNHAEFNEVGLIEIHKYLNIDEFAKELRRAEFALYKSKTEHNNPYFYDDKDPHQLAEYENYVHEREKLDEIVEKHGIETSWLTIKNYQSKSQVGYALFPKLKFGAENAHLKSFITNNSYIAWDVQNKFVESFAFSTDTFYKMISQSENKIERNEIITSEIFMSCLIDNYENIVVSNVVYIICQDLISYDVKLIRKIILHLNRSNIKVGFKIREFNENYSTYLCELRPQFLVVGKEISSNLKIFVDQEKNALAIVKIAEEIEAKIIYEDIFPDYDEITARSLDLTAFYNS